jgi:sporulation protein YlmC with PRC-barrel domain
MVMTTDTIKPANLIASDRVEGTSVYTSNGEKVGIIERVMLEKVSGKVAYAVLSFGGLLGFGSDQYPLPWSSLAYDSNIGGYRTSVTEAQLRGAPKYAKNSDWSWDAHARSVDDYYGRPIGG